MSSRIYIVGFRPPDDKWNAMLTVWNACKAAGVSIPTEVEKFFEGEDPTGKPGLDFELPNLKPVSGEDWDGYDIMLADLPKDLKIIRVCTRW